MRSLVILVAAVSVGTVLVSVAWADAPKTLNVKNGTVTHGDISSLAAIDGTTLDIQSSCCGKALVQMKAGYGNVPAGTVTLSYDLSNTSPRGCVLWLIVGGQSVGSAAFDPGTTYIGQIQATVPAGRATAHFKCRDPGGQQFTVSFDQLSLSSG